MTKRPTKSEIWRAFSETTNRDFHRPTDPIKLETIEEEKKGAIIRIPKTRISERDICEKCSTSLGVTEDGMLACPNPHCGVLYDRALNFAAEWRYFGADDAQSEDPARCSMPTDPNFEESSNVCILKYSRGMSHEMRKIQSRLAWTIPYKEKSQYDDFQHIITIANNNGMPRKLTNDAFKFYKQIFDSKNSFRGENRASIIAASIYIACMVNKCPRSAKEIADMFNIADSAATKGCKKAITIVKLLEKDMDEEDRTAFHASRPSLFIERYCNMLKIPYLHTLLAEFICLKLEYYAILPENTPQATAASVVFFISSVFNLGITKKDIKTDLDLSEVTITKCCKKIAAIQDRLIPDCISRP